MTWLELEPHRVPGTPQELERFADWLRLAEGLYEHDFELLTGLGFPTRHADFLHEFAAHSPRDEPPQERELRIESLSRLTTLGPALSSRAANEASALMFEETTVGFVEWADQQPVGFP